MLISQPERYSDASFAKQLREAVIASVTVSDAAAGKGRFRREAAREATVASVAATLSGKLEPDPNPLTAAERQLMQQWVTTLADSETA